MVIEEALEVGFAVKDDCGGAAEFWLGWGSGWSCWEIPEEMVRKFGAGL